MANGFEGGAQTPSSARRRLGVPKPDSLEASGSLVGDVGEGKTEGRDRTQLEAVGEVSAEDQEKALLSQEEEAREEENLQVEIGEIIPVIERVRGMVEDLKKLYANLEERRARRREERFQEEKAMGKYAGGGAATEAIERRGVAKSEVANLGMLKGVRSTRGPRTTR